MYPGRESGARVRALPLPLSGDLRVSTGAPPVLPLRWARSPASRRSPVGYVSVATVSVP